MLPTKPRPRTRPNRGQAKSRQSLATHKHSSNDDSLQCEIECSLSKSGYPPLAGITTTVEQGIVYLTGTVPSWYLKQVAQEVAMQITGLGLVRNLLTVAETPDDCRCLPPCSVSPDVPGSQLDLADIAALPDRTIRSMTRHELIAVINSCPEQYRPPHASLRLHFKDEATLIQLAFLVRRCCKSNLPNSVAETTDTSDAPN